MLGSSNFLENSGGGGVSAAVMEVGNEGGDGDKSSSGNNRWAQDETLALLRIRSEMDIAFRDSNVKAPLWDEVSRKLGELGYNRSAKKCKEKFENVHKYHKRIKEGKSDRQNSKQYKFFEQLQLVGKDFQVPSIPMVPNTNRGYDLPDPDQLDRDVVELMSASASTSSSSGKDSEGSVKKQRKMAEYFETLMKDVLEKQEGLQKTFLEALEKCENDSIAREEAWKAQEMERIKRERELMAQERAIASAKNEALLVFLQKISEQIQIPIQVPKIPHPVMNKPLEKPENSKEKFDSKHDNGVVENGVQTSSSRWPKAEIEALIMLKTDYDSKDQDSCPKGPLWEEISSGMRKFGYDRSSKRCKEKWENINKYYRRVKERNKKRPVDSKTCPYFDLLDSVYSKRFKKNDHRSGNDADENVMMMGQNQQQLQEPTGEFHDNIDLQIQEEDDDMENELE